MQLYHSQLIVIITKIIIVVIIAFNVVEQKKKKQQIHQHKYCHILSPIIGRVWKNSSERLPDRKIVTDRLITVRETSVSRHQGGSIEGPPEIPRTSQHYRIEGIKGD